MIQQLPNRRVMNPIYIILCILALLFSSCIGLPQASKSQTTPSLSLTESISDPFGQQENNQFGVPTYEPGFIPEIIEIEKIELRAPIIPVDQTIVSIEEQDYAQFLVPETYAAGWHTNSSRLGISGNTVINGHHNAYGEVFKDLKDLEVEDEITILSGDQEFPYIISNVMILEEREEPLEQRLQNAQWLRQSDDERLTLVTCWPEDTNTHRLILVAAPKPIDRTIDPFKIIPQIFQEIKVSTPAVERLLEIRSTPTPEIFFDLYNNAAENLPIRIAPDMEADIIDKFSTDSRAQVLGKSTRGGWLYIQIKDTHGWVETSLLNIPFEIDQIPEKE